uniref:Uncharacterized protein n=1 Tax=Oryza meridionalis TaxID=40149 RepID=A0A0E0CG80_9ORYZ
QGRDGKKIQRALQALAAARPPASPSRPLAAGEPAARRRPPAAVPAVRDVVSGPGVLGSRRVLDWSLDWRRTSPSARLAPTATGVVVGKGSPSLGQQ